MSPGELLAAVKRIERQRGRTPTFRNGPRVLDVDILDVGGEIVSGAGLVLPHPRLHRRRFVLEPLAAIAPRWRHPILKKTARQLLRELSRGSFAVRIPPATGRRGEGGARREPGGMRAPEPAAAAYRRVR
jgi:2-amino-4-hydroxy-6-hydroxymethyldihydropteridine diphosphokinase